MMMRSGLAFVVCCVATAVGCLGPSPLEQIGVRQIKIRSTDSVQVSVSPDTIKKSGQFVTVSWQGVSNPSSSDWFGMYLASDNVKETAPALWQFAKVDPDYLTTGRGKANIQTLNMRDDIVFIFFRNGTDFPIQAGVSNTVAITNKNEPLQGRLSLTNRSDEMMVTWTSRDVGTPVVRWGTVSGSYPNTVAATSYTYTRASMCGEPATTVGFRNPGTFHSAILTNLQPSTTVFYIFGDAIFGFSAEFSFTHTPAPGAAVQFVAFGDLGQQTIDDTQEQSQMPPSRNTTDGIIKSLDDFDLIVHVGDISYARGYVSQWEFFHDQIQPIATAMPYMTGIGNHERDYPNSGSARGGTDSGGECGVAYETRFVMPTEKLDTPWYSFNFGVIHLIMMSTEHEFDTSSAQYQFFVKDLQSINRKNTPWVIFAGHRPFYIDSTNNDPGDGDQTVATEMRNSFEKLLFDNQVDLIFGAHHHSYQRTCPVYQNQCRSKGANGYAAPVIVDIGMAGASNSQNLQPKMPAIFEFVDDSHYGFTRIIANTTHFNMKYIRGDDLQVHDEFTLAK